MSVWTTPRTWSRGELMLMFAHPGERVEVTAMNDARPRYLHRGRPCEYCGGRRKADGLGQCPGCGAPMEEGERW